MAGAFNTCGRQMEKLFVAAGLGEAVVFCQPWYMNSPLPNIEYGVNAAVAAYCGVRPSVVPYFRVYPAYIVVFGAVEVSAQNNEY